MPVEPKTLDEIVLRNDFGSEHALVVLPGRGGLAHDVARAYDLPLLGRLLIVSATPQNQEWYPAPNGPKDQRDAIEGLKYALQAIAELTKWIGRSFGIPPEKIALAGHSAGAVVAIHAGLNLPWQVPVVVSHAGAILEPEAVQADPERTTGFNLFHAKDDPVFSWRERYTPTKMALTRQGFRVSVFESDVGGHAMQPSDVEQGARAVVKAFCRPSTGVSCESSEGG